MKKFILLFFLFFNIELKSMQIINYDNPDKNIFDQSWELITDQVMGGESEGSFGFVENSEERFYRLKGTVSTKNNGGFIQFRSKVNLDKSDIQGIKFKVRGSGDKYFVHIRTLFTFLPWQFYSASFDTTKSWNEISIDFKNLERSHLFQPGEISATDIKSIGFVAYGKDFEAKLDVYDVELY